MAGAANDAATALIGRTHITNEGHSAKGGPIAFCYPNRILAAGRTTHRCSMDPYHDLREHFYAFARTQQEIGAACITGTYRSRDGSDSLCYVATDRGNHPVCLWDEYVAFMYERIRINDIRRDWPRFR